MKLDNSADQEHKQLPLFLFFQLITSLDALHPYPTGSASINYFDCYRGYKPPIRLTVAPDAVEPDREDLSGTPSS